MTEKGTVFYTDEQQGAVQFRQDKIWSVRESPLVMKSYYNNRCTTAGKKKLSGKWKLKSYAELKLEAKIHV